MPQGKVLDIVPVAGGSAPRLACAPLPLYPMHRGKISPSRWSWKSPRRLRRRSGKGRCWAGAGLSSPAGSWKSRWCLPVPSPQINGTGSLTG